MKMSTRLGAAIVAASMVTGCATVTRGTKQKFEIVSQPDGADVSTSNGVTCVTPCKLKLKRKHGFVATITKAGYKPAQVTVESSMHGGGTAGIAGNFVAGGLIGVAVDASNGSLNDLRPNPINVTLTPEGTPGPVVTPSAAPFTQPAPAPADPATTPTGTASSGTPNE